MTAAGANDKSVSIFTLGQFRVEVDGEPLRLAPRALRKPLELLKVVVAIGPNGAPITQLTDSLWPESDGDQAYGTFSVNLTRLRRSIGREPLTLQDSRLFLEPERCWVDAHAFADSLALASRAVEAGDGAEAWRHMEQALNLYKGPFLDGEYHPPEILAMREKLHGMFLNHIQRLGDYFQSSDQLPRAISLYQKGLEIDELAEEIYQSLMGCYLQSGRLVEGVTLYDRCRQIFQTSVDMEPSPRTDEIYEAIVAAQRRKQRERRDNAQPPHMATAEHPPATAPDAAQSPPRAHAGTLGERRAATVAFISLSGYAGLSGKQEQANAEQIMGRIADEVERVIASHGGIVKDVLGNRMVALFGIPAAHEDDPLRAVRAALHLRAAMPEICREVEQKSGRPLSVHTGISNGLLEIHRQDHGSSRYRLYGQTTTIGEKLASLAKANEVLVSPAIQHLIAPYFRTRALKATTPKGMAQPIVPYLVLEETGLRDRIHETSFVGRKEELRTLNALLNKAAGGHGQLVTVAGEAGIGKSRLLFEFRRAQRDKPIGVLLGRCRADGQNTPYLPFIDTLRRGLGIKADTPPDQIVARIVAIGGGLEAHLPVYLHLLSLSSEDYPLPPEMQGERLRRAVRAAMAAILELVSAGRPLILLLEGWHWADEASDSIVRSLSSVISQHPILVAVAYRPDRPIAWSHLDHHTHMALRPLDAGETGEIVKAVMQAEQIPEEFGRMIHRHTDGNPFFIEELCRDLQERRMVRVTDGRAVLTRSLNKLTFPESVQAVIRARLDRVEGEARDVLRLASVIGMDFSLAVLKRLHAQPADLDEPLDILQQLDLIQQVRVEPDAAYRFKHVITQKVVYDTLPLQQRGELHLRVAGAIENLYPERLEENLDALAHHYRNSTHPEKAIAFLHRAGTRATTLHSVLEARALYWSALELIDSQGKGAGQIQDRIDTVLDLASVSFYFPSSQLVQALEVSIKDAKALGDSRRFAQATFWTAFMHYGLGNYATGLGLFKEAARLPGFDQNVEMSCLTMNYRGRILFYLAEYTASIDYLQRGLETLKETDRLAEAANSLGMLALNLGYTGRFAECRRLFAEIAQISDSTHNPTVKAVADLCEGLVEDLRGNWREAQALLADSAVTTQEIGNHVMAGLAVLCRGHAAGMAGDLKRGIGLMDQGIEMIEGANSRFGLGACCGMTAEIYVMAGRKKAGTELADRALQYAQSGADKLGEPAACRALAMAAKGKKADTLIRKSLALAEERGERPNLAIGRFRYAEMLNDRGDAETAKSQLSQASKLFREMGMDWWHKQAAKLKRSLASR